MADSGVAEVIDFLVPAPGAASDRRRLVRMVRCVRGQTAAPLTIPSFVDVAGRLLEWGDGGSESNVQ